MRRVEWASGRVSPTGCTGGVGGRVNGRGVYVAGYADGQLQNPGRTHPAYRRFRPDGQVKYDLFYTRGQLQDPGPRSAAVRGFYANGPAHYEERYTPGQRNAGADGSAAIRTTRPAGTMPHDPHSLMGHRVRTLGTHCRSRMAANTPVI